MRSGVFLTCAIAVCTLAAGYGSAAPSGAFTQEGVVTQVVDGDTLAVRLSNGKQERVRLIGVDAAERGACFAAQATEHARRLALSRPIVLRGDATQDTRDRYGRLLAYVWIPGGRDLGYQLVARGYAKVYVYRTPFTGPSAYRTAETRAKSSSHGHVEGVRQHHDQTRRTVTASVPKLPPQLQPLPADRR